MRFLNRIRRYFQNSDRIAQSTAEILEGIKNVADVQNRAAQSLAAIVAGIQNETDLQNRKFEALIAAVTSHSASERAELSDGSRRQPQLSVLADAPRGQPRNGSAIQSAPRPTEVGRNGQSLREAMQQIPLLLDEKTYNTSHPDYDATVVRNFPGRILGRERPCDNAAFKALVEMARGDEVPDGSWEQILAAARREASAVPGAEQVFERYAFIERYMADISRTYGAHYVAGWVNLDDALFLYWLVRKIRPRTIIQTGVCNGLSAAFMMLALAKNGPEGRLRVIDLPPVFNPKDPAWTVAGKVYGVVIPEGKGTGWMVPDQYQNRFDVLNGDAKELMPSLVDSVDTIDIFYHDSDHTYNHMMFEFQQAKRKLRRGGLVIGDDISWNASLWDFADTFAVPSYNFKGAVGVAFF